MSKIEFIIFPQLYSLFLQGGHISTQSPKTAIIFLMYMLGHLFVCFALRKLFLQYILVVICFKYSSIHMSLLHILKTVSPKP